MNRVTGNMSDVSGLYLLKPFNSFPVSDTIDWLGRIVATYSDPRDKYTPNLKFKIQLEKDVDYNEDGGFRDVAQVLQHASTNTVKMNICDMFGLDLERMQSNEHHVESPRVWHLKLHNAEKILNDRLLGPLKATGTHRRHDVSGQVADELGEYRRAWMIVGFLLCENITYDETNDRGRHISGQIDPIRMAENCVIPGAGSATAFAPFPELSSNMQVQSTATQQNVTRTDVYGRRVFAIEYREVCVTAWWQFWRKATAKLGRTPEAPRLFVDSDSDDDDMQTEEEPVILHDTLVDTTTNAGKDPDLISFASSRDGAVPKTGDRAMEWLDDHMEILHI